MEAPVHPIRRVSRSGRGAVSFGAINPAAPSKAASSAGAIPQPAPVCAVSAQSLRTEIWPRPVLAVGLMRFKPVDVARPCSQK